MSYRVHLDNFDGPLDLLLFLIKKNEVDLFDIPIAAITQQFLEYLEVITTLDLEGASDFILMAATLIRIKAQMLLPKSEIESDEEEEDPRDELVRRLLDYQRFKEVATKMSDFEEARRLVYPRAYFDYSFAEESDVTWDPVKNFTLFDLMTVFKEVLQKTAKVSEHLVEKIPVTAEEQMDFILAQLEAHQGQVLFSKLLEATQNHLIMIVTFVALLEMIRRGRVEVVQSKTFGEIWLRKRGWNSAN